MDNPLPSLSDALCFAGTLDQVGSRDILAGSNNIYIGTNGRNETLQAFQAAPGADSGRAVTPAMAEYIASVQPSLG
jgi:hypothetical protein